MALDVKPKNIDNHYGIHWEGSVTGIYVTNEVRKTDADDVVVNYSPSPREGPSSVPPLCPQICSCQPKPSMLHPFPTESIVHAVVLLTSSALLTMSPSPRNTTSTVAPDGISDRHGREAIHRKNRFSHGLRLICRFFRSDESSSQT